MKKEIFINESMGETRIAIQEDGQIVEVYIERQDKQRMVGNIYKGKVENVLPGMQAAFVDIGYELNAFLPFSEIANPDYIIEDDTDGNQKKKSKSDNIEVDLQTNQEIYVQVIKEPFAGKGPRVTNSWNRVSKVAEKEEAPALVYEDLETASSVVRDLLTPDVEKIIIDSKRLFKKTQKYLEEVSPSLAERLELYKLKLPLFESFGIDSEIEKLMRPKAWLKSGAYLIIEKTEAMVVIDVNSGKFVGKKLHEENSLKINLEAAREVARQLRLRDLSGLVVIDFIDMRLEENRKKIYHELRKELRKDRAKVAVSPITEFGLLEMTRQRIRVSLLDSMSEECPTCYGSGRIISKETLISRIEHWLRRYKSKHRDLRIILQLHEENADYIKNDKKNILRGLMWKNFVHIKIETNKDVGRDEFRFIKSKTGKDITNELALDKDISMA